jgi:ATP-dependent protease Clp ATPase subunit
MQDDERRLVAGPGVCICEECARLALATLDAEADGGAAGAG